jgi:nicotinate-nucleotide adenylyltransferase
MCRRAVDGYNDVSVSSVEADMGGESRTIDTVRELKSRHPDETFALIIGSDILAETDQWKQWDELMEMVSLVVIGRQGHDEPSNEGQDGAITLPDVSSTRTREALRQRDRAWLETWIPRRVLTYIDEHELYL